MTTENLTTTNNPYDIDAIRIHSNTGIAGLCFSRKQVVVEETPMQSKIIEIEEKNLKKLKLSDLHNTMACPVVDQTSGTALGVLQVYNRSEGSFFSEDDKGLLGKYADYLATVFFNLDSFQVCSSSCSYVLNDLTYRVL